jgi:hypothetical protein
MSDRKAASSSSFGGCVWTVSSSFIRHHHPYRQPIRPIRPTNQPIRPTNQPTSGTTTGIQSPSPPPPPKTRAIVGHILPSLILAHSALAFSYLLPSLLFCQVDSLQALTKKRKTTEKKAIKQKIPSSAAKSDDDTHSARPTNPKTLLSPRFCRHSLSLRRSQNNQQHPNTHTYTPHLHTPLKTNRKQFAKSDKYAWTLDKYRVHHFFNSFSHVRKQTC